MSSIVDMMNEKGVELTVHHYYIVMRMCLKTHRVRELFQIFDLMKFRSVKSLPDTRIYSMMITACGATKEAERALDLYREMTTRPIEPQESDQMTLRSLIYACSKRADYRQKAWQFALEYQQRGYPVNVIMPHLLYICALSGDVTHARFFFLKMCTDSAVYPGELEFQYLMRCYSLWFSGAKKEKNGTESSANVLRGDIGDDVRAAFLSKINFETHISAPEVPPFLPVLQLNKAQIIEEARAIMLYLQTFRPHVITPNIVCSYLNVALNGKQKTTFRHWFAETTVPQIDPATSSIPDAAYIGKVGKRIDNSNIHSSSGETNIPSSSNRNNLHELIDPRFSTKVTRNRHIYETALQGAYACLTPPNRDISFAEALYAEREYWKRSSEEYSAFTDSQREESDRMAAKYLINAYARTENFRPAVEILRDTVSKLDWTFEDLTTLHNKAHQCEVDAVLKAISWVVRVVKERKASRLSSLALTPLI